MKEGQLLLRLFVCSEQERNNSGRPGMYLQAADNRSHFIIRQIQVFFTNADLCTGWAFDILCRTGSVLYSFP